MKTVETASYPVQIWIAGDHAKAVELCRAYCDEGGEAGAGGGEDAHAAYAPAARMLDQF